MPITISADLKERIMLVKQAKKDGKKPTGFLDAGEVIVNDNHGDTVAEFDSSELQLALCLLLGIPAENV